MAATKSAVKKAQAPDPGSGACLCVAKFYLPKRCALEPYFCAVGEQRPDHPGQRPPDLVHCVLSGHYPVLRGPFCHLGPSLTALKLNAQCGGEHGTGIPRPIHHPPADAVPQPSHRGRLPAQRRVVLRLVAGTDWSRHTMGKVTTFDVQCYRDHLMDARRKPATINRRTAALRAFFAWAVDVGLLV